MQLTIQLRPDDFIRLEDLSRVERRRPREQAAILIERALREQASKEAIDARA